MSDTNAIQRGGWTTSKAIIMFVVVFCGSLLVSGSQMKVSPILTLMMDDLGLDMTQSGLLTSMYSLSSIILVIPAGLIGQKLGLRTVSLCAMGSLVVGGVLGAIATTIPVLFVARIIEGIAMGMFNIAAPTLINEGFPGKNRGLAVGLWSTWMSIGSIIVMSLAPAIAGSSGWRMVFWVYAIAALVIFVAFVFLKLPDTSAASQQNAEVPKLSQGFQNKSIWLISLAMGIYALCFICLMQFYPAYLIQVKGFELASAGMIASIPNMVMIVSPIIAGWISDRIGKKKVYSVAFLLFAVIMLLPFNVDGAGIIVFAVCLGLAGGLIPAPIYASVPNIMKSPMLISVGMAIVSLCQNIGTFVGPTFFGAMCDSLGWQIAGYVLIPLLVVAFVLGVLAKNVDASKDERVDTAA